MSSSYHACLASPFLTEPSPSPLTLDIVWWFCPSSFIDLSQNRISFTAQAGLKPLWNLNGLQMASVLLPQPSKCQEHRVSHHALLDIVCDEHQQNHALRNLTSNDNNNKQKHQNWSQQGQEGIFLVYLFTEMGLISPYTTMSSSLHYSSWGIHFQGILGNILILLLFFFYSLVQMNPETKLTQELLISYHNTKESKKRNEMGKGKYLKTEGYSEKRRRNRIGRRSRGGGRFYYRPFLPFIHPALKILLEW